MKKIKQANFGFSLIELLVVISIVGVMASFAIPSFKTIIQNGKLTTTVNNLLVDFKMTRNEAVNKGVPTAFCASDDGNNCGNANFQDSNWILIWHDLNRNSVIDLNELPIVKKHFEPFNQPIFIAELDMNLPTAYVMYLPSGTARNSNGNVLAGNFLICDDRQGNFGRRMILNFTGRTRVQKGTEAEPENCP